MKLILPLAFSLLFISLNAQTFIEQEDKKLHYAAGILYGSVGYSYVWLKTKNKNKAIMGGLCSSLMVGIGKELIDSTQKGNMFDVEDLAATALGGISIGVTFNLFKNEKNSKKIRKRRLGLFIGPNNSR
tara:strand:- start:837 stop:1223 length:387 start_codon:yes stop_codon:yes gene_type:complete